MLSKSNKIKLIKKNECENKNTIINENSFNDELSEKYIYSINNNPE